MGSTVGRHRVRVELRRGAWLRERASALLALLAIVRSAVAEAAKDLVPIVQRGHADALAAAADLGMRGGDALHGTRARLAAGRVRILLRARALDVALAALWRDLRARSAVLLEVGRDHAEVVADQLGLARSAVSARPRSLLPEAGRFARRTAVAVGPRARRSAIVLAALLVPALGGSALGAGLPDPRELSATPLALPSQVFDRDGNLLYQFEEERRELVALDDVPAILQQATIAVEDRTFWTNPGVDFGGIARAAISNLREGRVTQGASTITQQLVKARIVGEEQSFERKLREAFLAVRVTQTYPKREILEMYLNQVYYGNRSYGVRAAAKSYFGITDLRALTLGQAALLAGLPQRPSVYDPVVNPDAARARRVQVLEAMVEEGFVREDDARAAAAEPIVARAAETAIRYPHVVFRVREEVARALGSERAAVIGGYRIYTTIDPGLQSIAERQVRERVAALKGNNLNNAALIAMDPKNGHIFAYVGSVDYNDHSPRVRGDFDVAGLGERQVGSTFKLFTYLTALRKGYTPSSVIWDVSTNFAPAGQPTYRPKNAPSLWGSSPENGPITIRQAIRESLNIPAVKLTAMVGIDEIIQTARLLGVEREWDRSRIGLAFGIGAGEMTLRELAGAYQVVANMGARVEPTLVLRIEDRDGRIVRDWSRPSASQAISPQLAWLMSDLLKDTTDPNGSPIFGSWTNIGRAAALKTGTTDDLRDVLAVGYLPDLLTAVWMGNSDNSEMFGINSAMGPGVLWRDFMKEALASRNIPPSWYPRPDGIVERTVCAKPGAYGGPGSGMLPSTLCPSSWRTVEKFVSGTEPRTDDRAFFGTRCVQPRAERPEWQQDLVRWAAAGKNGRLGMSICGVSKPPPSPTPPPDTQPGKRRR